MLQGADGEQHQPDHRCERHHHQPVRPRVLEAEEVGEAYSRYPPEDQDGPEDPGDALLRRDRASSWRWGPLGSGSRCPSQKISATALDSCSTVSLAASYCSHTAMTTSAKSTA